MKKILLFLLVTLTLPAFAQNPVIEKANELIAGKKYQSAFELLDQADPDNNNPDMVLLKEKILLNYFVVSLMHQMFGLKDLKKDEDITDYRGKNGQYEMFRFRADSILQRLIRKYPDNCQLYKGLGDYYFDAYMRYGKQWVKSEDELLKQIQENYRKAAEMKCADARTYYVLGYTHLLQNNLQESISYLEKSVQLNDTLAETHYNLAYAYMAADQKKKALQHALKATDLYQDKEYKSDAARMAGILYMDLNDEQMAVKLLEKADSIDPGNYYNLAPLLSLYVKTNNPKKKETTEKFFLLDPGNATIYNDLTGIYLENNQAGEIENFFKSKLKTYQDQPKIVGNLHFYLGQLYLQTDKKSLAKEHFLKARKFFEKVFEPEHPVFEVIKQGIEQCK